MGCATSKLEGEDTVSRCRERRRLMKLAVKSRHLFAAAHSDYLRFLRLTGSALSHFSAGESLSVADGTPPVFLSRSLSSSAAAPPPPAFHRPAESQSFHQTTISATDSFSTNPPLPAKTMPAGVFIVRPEPASSTPSPTHSISGFSHSTDILAAGKPKVSGKTNSSCTPSQSSSSMWNWENFYPPSPPESDFYRQREEAKSREHEENDIGGRDEMQCSDWGDGHCCTSSEGGSDDDGRSDREPENVEFRYESWVPAEPVEKFGQRSDNEEVVGFSVKWNEGVGELKMMRRHKDLTEIAVALEECFVKAAEAGKELGELLEMDREQLDRSFRQLTRTVYHSNNFFTNLSSSWTSKPPLAIKYSMKTGALIESGSQKSHCSTLEQLLAWEKKLYEEVKAREGAKIEHEKKLNLLQSQEYRGEKEVKLDKTKASIKKLQSLIMVASQAVNTTSSAITMVRDTELGPQLLELCHGLMKMWKSMNHFHDIQNDIVQQVRGLTNCAAVGDSTTDLHRQSTHHLQLAVSGWHSSFSRLIKHHRSYIHSLHSWLRLTLHRIDDSPESVPAATVPAASECASHIYSLCDEWRHAVDRIPDTVASEAIKSFVTVIQTITLQQSEELRCQKRSEASARELEKKSAAFRAVEKKFYGSVSSYSMAGINIPGSGSDPATIDARDPLAEKRLTVQSCRRRAEEELLNYRKAMQVTRAMTLNNIQTGLPGVFQSMTAFSGVCSEVFEAVCNHAGVGI